MPLLNSITTPYAEAFLQVASTKKEISLVKNHVSRARFVKEVYNYIILIDDTR